MPCLSAEEVVAEIERAIPAWESALAKAALRAAIDAIRGDMGPLRAAERFWDGQKWLKDASLAEDRHHVSHRVVHECDDCSFESDDPY